jgi:ABC-2 type transport system permease protein
MRTLPEFAAQEVRHQLRSPVSWLLIAVFALLAGAAFVAALDVFLDAALEALSAPPARPVNVNQLLIRPFLVQAGIAALLVLPFLTARAFTARSADEQAPGTVIPRVVAPFIGVMTVYAVMLAASFILVLGLFLYGAPEWGPIASGYFGLVLVGAAFIAAALFIASLATSAGPAAAATFALALALAASSWLALSAAPGARPVFQRLSVGVALDDFARGVIDAGHVVTCVTIVAVALFLTAHTLEPGRQDR